MFFQAVNHFTMFSESLWPPAAAPPEPERPRQRGQCQRRPDAETLVNLVAGLWLHLAGHALPQAGQPQQEQQ